MDGLLQGVQHEARVRRAADAPPHDPPGEGVDHEGDVHEALPGGDVCEVADPQHVRRRNPELPVHAVQRAWSGLVRDGGPDQLPPDHALEPQVLHQPRHRAPRDVEAFAPQLPPDLAHAVDPVVLLEDAPDLRAQGIVPPRPLRSPRRLRPLGQMIVVGGRGDRQHPTDRLDPMLRPMIVDEGDHDFDRRSSSAWAK